MNRFIDFNDRGIVVSLCHISAVTTALGCMYAGSTFGLYFPRTFVDCLGETDTSAVSLCCYDSLSKVAYMLPNGVALCDKLLCCIPVSNPMTGGTYYMGFNTRLECVEFLHALRQFFHAQATAKLVSLPTALHRTSYIYKPYVNAPAQEWLVQLLTDLTRLLLQLLLVDEKIITNFNREYWCKAITGEERAPSDK